nr:solute carrier family 35 member E3-like isoform X1 [Ciona intestinalis]|eukprot:XP_009858702.2 solute carrier family 35 member E3-like isoform X1 [Ciona intestinalis]
MIQVGEREVDLQRRKDLELDIQPRFQDNVMSDDVITVNEGGKQVALIALTVNFVASVLIILSNKALYVNYGVPPLFLACFHFLSTFVGLLGMLFAGYLQVKRVPIIKVIPLCLAFCSFIVFTSLSLKYNQVRTYQLIKCLGDPLTFVIQAVFYGRHFTTKTKLALSMVVGGILINYSTDIQLNFLGALFGLTAVVASSLYYTWIETKQRKLELSPPQLLIYQSSISSAILSVLVVAIELPDVLKIMNTSNASDAAMFFLSGLLAFSVSTSVFYIISKTSVVTYAVFCKLKICLIILGGSILFKEVITPGQAMGVIVTLTGTAMYAFFTMSEKNKLDKTLLSNSNGPTLRGMS